MSSEEEELVWGAKTLALLEAKWGKGEMATVELDAKDILSLQTWKEKYDRIVEKSISFHNPVAWLSSRDSLEEEIVFLGTGFVAVPRHHPVCGEFHRTGDAFLPPGIYRRFPTVHPFKFGICSEERYKRAMDAVSPSLVDFKKRLADRELEIRMQRSERERMRTADGSR